MAGRPRKPDHVKKQQGTLQKCRINDRPLTYETISVPPEAPAELGEHGRNLFNYVCALLVSKRLLTAAYLVDIEMASQQYEIYKKCVRNMNDNGMFHVTSNGYEVERPCMNRMDKAYKFVTEFNNRYGLNLISGQKIEMPAPEEDDDLMKALKGFSNGL